MKDIVVVVGFSRMINSALHYEEVNSVQKEHLLLLMHTIPNIAIIKKEFHHSQQSVIFTE